MRRLLFILVLALLVIPVIAQADIVWHATNQATVSWDAPTLMEDGGPIPLGTVFQYRVFTKTPSGTITELGVTNNTSYIVTLADGQKVYVGARIERLVDSVVEAISVMAWSDVPTDCLNQVTFGVKFFKAPQGPRNLR